MTFHTKNIQRPIAALLLVSMLLPAFIFMSVPKKAEALPNVCQILTNAVFGKAKEAAVEAAKKAAEEKAKNKAKETLGGIISTSVPVKDSAATDALTSIKGNTATTAAKTTNQWATEICKQVLMSIARKLLDKITQNTIKWINTGFHGNPLYIQNADSFFKDIAKSEVKSFVDVLGYDSLRFPFGKNAALNAIGIYQSKFEDNARYTLSKSTSDPNTLSQYRNNFAYGGWSVFLTNTQYPQNNPVGFQILAAEELGRKVANTTQNAAQKVNNTLQQGMGFLSPKVCLSNPSYNNLKNEFRQPIWTESKEYNEFLKNNPEPDALMRDFEELHGEWEDGLAQAKAEWGVTNTCKDLASTTPGSVVASSIMESMNSKLHQTELGAALGNSLSAVFDALLNHFFKKGLSGLTGADVSSSAAEVIPYDDTNFIDDPEGGSCKVKPGSHGNDVGAPSTVDINNAIFEQSGEVKNWEETGKVTGVSADNTAITVQYDKSNTWPEAENEGTTAVGNPWIFVWRGGAWHTETFSWLRPGQSSKDIGDIICGGVGGSQTLGDFVPVPGETYGFMVSGVARPGGNRNISERTDIFMYTWPSGINFVGYNTGEEETDTPPPSEGIRSDLSNVTILGGSPADIGTWNVTSEMTKVEFASNGTDISVDHTKRGQWPAIQFEGAEQEATLWIFFNINGKWYGTGGERLRPNQTTKGESFSAASQIGQEWFYDSTWGPMASYSPAKGEYVGFMISAGIGRGGNTTIVKERTNVVYIKYPADNTQASFPPFSSLP